MSVDKINTERLILRRIKLQDRTALVDMLSRWEVARMLCRWPHPVDETMIDDLIDRHQGSKPGGFAITHNDQLIGLISESSQIGFMLHPDAWGQGFMTEALEAVQSHLLKKHEALLAGAFTDNPASMRVLEKCGWQRAEPDQEYCRARNETLPSVNFVKCRRYDWMDPIKTERLYLRPLSHNDFDNVWPILSDKGIVEMLLSWPWPPDEAFVRARLTNANARAGLVSAIECEGDVIGVIGYAKGSIYYFFRREAWGKGYASEAARAKINRAFCDPNLDAVTAGTWDDNAASMRVLQKLGFRQTRRDTVFHSARGMNVSGPDFELTRETWEAAR